MSATTVWVKAADVTLTIAGTPQLCTDCTEERTAGEFETTNLQSPLDPNGLLQYEGGNDVVTTKLNGTVVVDKAAADELEIGTILAASFSVDGGVSRSGSLRLSSSSRSGTPKGAYQVKWSGTFTGDVAAS